MFLAALVAIPVTEIYLFIEIGDEIGALNTIILTILTAVAGMALLRIQGLSVLMKAQENLENGQSPIKEVFSGILLAIAGLFLLIPGFFTDSIGFLLFLPPLRAALAGWLSRTVTPSGRGGFHQTHFHSRRWNGNEETIIDGEYNIVEEDEKTDPAGRSNSDPRRLDRPEGGPDDSPWSKNG
ncbi:FxsA family protein [Sneathiella chinensis]|uniref:FxsA family protein n=1 Tax=Sneathiella chinensis TaxID=349750 RepID=UPI0019D0349D|nr:FxsA family protein [Sneathiella chinensis]